MKNLRCSIMAIGRYWTLLICSFLFADLVLAQQEVPAGGLPITISLFSESVSLPDLHSLFRNAGWGIRLGTEHHYTRNNSRTWLQTLNLGFYRHSRWQSGIYLNSEFGYRKTFNSIYTDITIGVGYLHLVAHPGRYRPTEGGFEKTTAHLHRIMPTFGVGLGVDAGRLSLFSRLEAFGEFPFHYGGTPVLPHRALHFGTRFTP